MTRPLTLGEPGITLGEHNVVLGNTWLEDDPIGDLLTTTSAPDPVLLSANDKRASLHEASVPSGELHEVEAAL